ncbi:MAG: MBL fold metallo-hydrolase [Bacteroidota bacterium]
MTLFIFPLILSIVATTQSQSNSAGLQEDTIATSTGELRITFFGHASVMFHYDGKSVYVDPVRRYADFSKLPRADVVLVTHQHSDHFDPGAIEEISAPSTVVVLTKACVDTMHTAETMQNGDVRTFGGIRVEAVPAYNLVHKRENGMPFHPKGEGNGYVITFGRTRVYVAGDTENIPEMKALRGIDIAFLPMNLPYTMTPDMVADAARAFRPGILYPYHYGDTDPQKLVELLKNEKGIDVRVRNMR